MSNCERQSEVLCEAPRVGVLRDTTSQRLYFSLPLVLEELCNLAHASGESAAVVPERLATELVRRLHQYADGIERRAA